MIPPETLLHDWLTPRVPPLALAWLAGSRTQAATGDTRAFFLAFGMAPRKVGKADLHLTDAEKQAATVARPGWNPSSWTVDQAARTHLVLALPFTDAAALVATLDKLFAASDGGELVALYQMLPLLPHPEAHRLRAAEGIRTSMKAVFCAVAHHNPYPAEQLDEAAWNQMVLKCLFIGAALDPVLGLDRRGNATLARMLVDYAHERWAAGRPVSPELWRVVGPHADDRAIADLKEVLDEGGMTEREAAVLALMASPHPGAAEALGYAPDLVERARAGEFTWRTIAGTCV